MLDAFGSGRDERPSRQMWSSLLRDGAHETRGHHQQHQVRVPHRRRHVVCEEHLGGHRKAGQIGCVFAFGCNLLGKALVVRPHAGTVT